MLTAVKIAVCIRTTPVLPQPVQPPLQPTLAPQTELRTTFSLLNMRRKTDPIDVACRIINSAGITCTTSNLRIEGKPQQMPSSVPPRSYCHISVPMNMGRRITETMAQTELKEMNKGVEDCAIISRYKTQEELLDDELLQIGITVLPELDDKSESSTFEVDGVTITYRRVGDNSRFIPRWSH